jgi:hypothetical protein
VFRDAADVLANWGGGPDGTGRFQVGPSRGATGAIKGCAPGARACGTDLFVATDQDRGDFWGTTVHEIAHVKHGGGHGRSNPPHLAMCQDGLRNLPSLLSAAAPMLRRSLTSGCPWPR